MKLQFLLIILEKAAQGGCGIFFRISELEITDELVDGTPYAYCFRLGSAGCLVFYLDIILSDIGDIEAAVVSEAYQEMAVFLAILLDLLHHAYPTLQRSVEDADGIILEDEVIIALIYDAESLNVFRNLFIIVDEPFHIRIWDAGEVDDLTEGIVLSIGTEESSPGEEGTFYRLSGVPIDIISHVFEIAVMGKVSLQCLPVFCPDEEEA